MKNALRTDLLALAWGGGAQYKSSYCGNRILVGEEGKHKITRTLKDLHVYDDSVKGT